MAAKILDFLSNFVSWRSLVIGELYKLTKMPVFGHNVIVIFGKKCKFWMFLKVRDKSNYVTGGYAVCFFVRILLFTVFY